MSGIKRGNMKYMRSKNRVAKYILPIMLKGRTDEPWVEPFVGGGNIIDKVDGECYGYDLDKWVIQALKSIRDSIQELPKDNTEFTEEDYKKLKLNDEYKHKGYAGFSFSYGGKWLGGWCRDKEGKRDYIAEAYRNALKQSLNLQNVGLNQCDYKDIKLTRKSIIYCDPPYRNTTKYNNTFDHEEFWKWCRKMSLEGHKVFISEYQAPHDFNCVWSKEINSSLTQETGSKKGLEKLFVYKELLT